MLVHYLSQIPKVPLKDYYLTLGIAHTASPGDIKTAYRSLAVKYHPDKATDNPFAEAHFREIAEAYAVLSHPAKRRAYDEELWLTGATSRTRKAGARISADWILSEAEKLVRHMETVDTYRMNHAALRDYILLLLSDEHLSIWRDEATAEQQTKLVDIVLTATRGQKLIWFFPIADRLLMTGNPDPALPGLIKLAIDERRKREKQDKWLPLIIVLASIVICLAAFYLLHP